MYYYPYDDPIILNDAVFELYGGQTGSSTAAQREIAYVLAEEAMYQHMKTFLQPTIVTGTYVFDIANGQVFLDQVRVNRVDIVRFLDQKDVIYHTITGTSNYQASLLDKETGLLDIHYWTGNCGCPGAGYVYCPYKVQVVYEAGLPTGVSIQKNMLMALSAAADLYLGEILGYGNEAPGMVGLTEFRNQQYSEKRQAFVRTIFGTNPRAQMIINLVRRFTSNTKRYVGL